MGKAMLAKNPVSPARTTSGINLDMVYTPSELEDFDYLRILGFQGSFPLQGVSIQLCTGETLVHEAICWFCRC